VLIGTGCDIQDCRLGPDVSIGDDCVLHGCELRNVQVHSGCSLRAVRDSDCIYAGDLRLPAQG
jgi:hypothetical protein